MSRLDDLLKDTNVKGVLKSYAGSAIRTAKEVEAKSPPMISTGNWPLDSRLGGGIRPARFHTFYGPESSGKTFSVLKTIATFQESCARCYQHSLLCQCEEGVREPVIFLVLTEDWPVGGWAEAIGVDTDKLLLSEPTCGEEGLDQMDVLLRTGKVDLICLDSLAFLTPLKEVQESVTKDHMGVTARMIGQATRKLLTGFKAMERQGHYPTVLCTNQIRQDLSVMFGNPETKPGGHAPEFAAASETRFGASKPHYNKDLQQSDYAECRFKIKKNKQWSPAGEGKFQIVFTDGLTKKRGDIADEDAMLTDARRLGLVTEEKKKWRLFDTEYRTLQDVTDALATDLKLKLEVRSALLTLMLP